MGLATRTLSSPNYYRQGWMYGPPTHVFIHATRSGDEGRSHVKELASTIAWFSNPESQASSQWILSPTERVRMVPDSYPSWATGWHNFTGYNIELTQPTLRTPFQPGHYRNLAIVCAPYVLSGIPIVRLNGLAQGAQLPSGFIGHEDTDQGKSVGKSDPGPMFNWDEFFRELKHELEPVTTEEDDMILWRSPHGGHTNEIYIVSFAGDEGGRKYHIPNSDTFRALGLGRYPIFMPEVSEFDGIRTRPWSKS